MLCSCEGFTVMKKIGSHEWQCPKCGRIVWEAITEQVKERRKW